MYYVNGDLDQFLHVSLLVDNNQVLSQNQHFEASKSGWLTSCVSELLWCQNPHVRVIESPCLWPSRFSP
jgi:hypothetical protein